MCGIAGWVNYGRNLEAYRDAVEAITESISRRGPDTGEVWIGGPAALAHRHLSVIDFDGGKQPMEAKENGETIACLSYNGEIFNADTLRDQLKSFGHQFRTRSDTEVVLRGFLEWGDEVAERLVGIFAFAIWDVRKQWLFLFRDRMGVKTLFYHLTDAGILFGSEPTAMVAHPDVPLRAGIGLSQYLPASALETGQAIYQGMHEVPVGHIVRLTRKGLATRRYRPLDARSQDAVRQQTLSTVHSGFEGRFTKNRNLIAFVARRLLGCQKEAEEAVKECFKTASRNPPVLTNEGAFRSWILRIVIDEAMLILSQKSNGANLRQTFEREAPCSVLAE